MKSLPDRQRPQLNITPRSAIVGLQIPAKSRRNEHCSRDRLQARAGRTRSQIYYREPSHGRSLQPFSFDVEVSAATAKQDRIHVIFGAWEVYGTTDQIDELRELMGSPRIVNRGWGGVATSQTFGRTFNRPQKHRLFRPALSVRRKRLRVGNKTFAPPLHSGRCVFTPYARIDGRITRSKVYLEFYLNPTRYFLYQPFSPLPDLLQRGAWPEPRLFGNRLPSEFEGEFSYDGKDNWIPNTQRAAALSIPARWKKHLETYLRAIPARFEEELKRLNSLGPNTRILKTEGVTLIGAELYWDFECADSLDAVEELCQPFFTLIRGHRRAVFRPVRAKHADGNSMSLATDVSPGEQLRAYAKTNKRIRCEVAFTFKKNGYRLVGGHTAKQWGDLPRMLEKLADKAAWRVNWALKHFKKQTEIVPSGMSADDLLRQVRVCSPDSAVANAITSILKHLGSIAARGMPKRISRTCRCLRKNGVFDYRADAGLGGNYVVTAPYLSALHEWQERRNL